MDKRYTRLLVIVIILCNNFFTGCTKKDQTGRGRKVSVVVSILPLKFFVDKIGDTLVDVTVMVEPGTSPHIYEPKPSQIVTLSQAALYFTIGVEFENVWLPRFLQTARNLSVVPLDSGVEKLTMDKSYNVRKQPNRDSAHGHHELSGLDPHIWLSPELVKGMVEKIAAALCRIDQRHCLGYQARKEQFISEIASLQKNIQTILEENQVNKIMVFHPSWGYFAREFNLHQIPIELAGKEPLPKELIRLVKIARKENIRTVFVQPQFSQKTAGTIAAQIAGSVLAIDPLAYQWDKNLESVAHALVGK